MRTYKAKDLRLEFEILKNKFRDGCYTLVPLLDAAFTSWLKKLPLDSRVSDMVEGPLKSYYCVVNGKLVTVNADLLDLDGNNMVQMVSFKGKEEDCLYSMFRNLVSQQDLAGLTKVAIEKLEPDDKIKTYKKGGCIRSELTHEQEISLTHYSIKRSTLCLISLRLLYNDILAGCPK